MPSAARRVPAFVLLTALAAVVTTDAGSARVASAQSDAKKDDAKAPEPTADEVAALGAKFKAEREAAVAAKFPAEALTRADDLAKRAAAALAAKNARAAARYYRDARWQLPYLPVNLPPHVARVFGESRMRHPDRVNAVAYSPDLTRLASASADFTVKVWDLGNGRELVTYRGHAEQADDASKEANVLGVGGVAFHPKQNVAASVGGTQVHLWAPDTGKLIKVLAKIEKTDKPLKCVAFSPDGKSLAVGGDDGILRVFTVETGQAAFTGSPRNARIERVAYSPNGVLVGVADSAGNVAVYAPGVGNGMPMSTGVIANGGECLGVGFTADSRSVFACGRDGKARLIAGPNPDGTAAGNTSTTHREFVGHAGAVTDLAVTPDGKQLVTGGEDRTVRVWDVTSGKQVRSFQGHMAKPDGRGSALAVAIRPDGRQVASASEDGTIRLWDVSTADDHRALTDATGPVWTVAVSPDGRHAAAAGADRTIRVYDPETGKLEATLTGHSAPVTAVDFFPDNTRLVSAGGDRVVRVWDVPTQKVVRELSGHESAVLAVAVGAGGKLVVTGGADRTARGWDPDGGKQLWSWTGKSAVCAVATRAGGKQVAVGTADGTLVVLDVSAGSPKEVSAQAAHIAGVAGVAYSPDGSKLATVGGDGALRLWTLAETGTPVPLTRFDGQAKPGTATGFAALSAVAFSPDGRFVAGAGADTVVRVWDVQSKAEVRGLRGHTDWATAVAFGPDARLLVSAGADKVVRVFELSPQEGGTATGHLLAVNAVAVSPDGKQAATASVDQTIKLWDLASGREVATLIGNTDLPYTVTYLGTQAVVVGGTLRQGVTGHLHFWQTKPPQLVTSVVSGQVYTAAGAADGTRVAAWSTRPVTGDGDGDHKISTFEVYDAAGKLLTSHADKGHKPKAAAFSADLAWAVAGDETGTVRVFDLGAKKQVGGDWPLFQTAVGDLGVTPDKKTLAAIDHKGVLKVADVAKRETLASAEAHPAGMRGLVVSPTGDTVVTIGADREVKVWPLTGVKELKPLRSWKLPVGVNGAAYTPDGKSVVTANTDGTAYVLELP